MWIALGLLLGLLGFLLWTRKETFEGSAPQFLVSKYGEFSSATAIPRVEATAPPLPTFEGKDMLTLADIKLVKSQIDSQLTRLETIRSSAQGYQEKQIALEELSFRLTNIIQDITRGAPVEDYPIRTQTAITFLEKFRFLDSVPPLLETIPAPSPQEVPLVALVHKLKMELEQRETTNDDTVYMERLKELEKRMLGNSILGNPIPSDLRNEFLDILKNVYTSLVS